MNILVIDNHPLVLIGIKQEIKDHNPKAKVTLVNQIDQGIGTIKNKSFDLIIIEIGISGCNVQTIRKIRAAQPNTKILVFSWMSEMKYALPAIALGANGFVSKESSINELIIAVDTVLASKTYHSNKVHKPLFSKVITNKDTLEIMHRNHL